MFNLKIIKNTAISISSLLMMLNVVLVGLATPASAETTEPNNNSDYGLPSHRRDGGSRGGDDTCVGDQTTNLVAIVPEETIGINASTSPKLFFYVPKINQGKTLEFVLRNEQDELMYEAFITTTGEGIISVDVPADVQANIDKKEQNYHWYLSLICNFQQRSRDIVVEGWMRQSVMDVATKKELDSADSIAQAELYHQQGFWFDALAVLANNYESKVAQPMIKAKWSELLKSVGLAEVAAAPLISSEVIESSY
jgi:Domain of Unknown Function (DUF928)